MITSRARFMRTLEFKTVDEPWMRWGSFLWEDTLPNWRQQGYDGRPLNEFFEVDTLLRVDPWYGPLPEFAYQVIEEDELTRLYINHEGILMREFKEHPDTSMPQFVKFPVENETDYEKLSKERLGLNPEFRFSEEWKRQVSKGRVQTSGGKAETYEIGSGVSSDHGIAPIEIPLDAESPRKCWADRWGGFFGPLRNMMGLEGLCIAFYDQPKLVERMMAERADAIIEITNEVLKYTDFEVFWFWEDMAYNAGPLVSPDMFRKFALPHYRRVCDWLHSRGIRHIGLDSDGDISLLIPIWLEVGIDHLWPFEVQSGMDVVQVRQTYGHNLALMGGIDKRAVAKGGEAMRHEVDRVMPVVEDGGYIPEIDHSVPPNVPWANFCEYIEYLKLRLGRG